MKLRNAALIFFFFFWADFKKNQRSFQFFLKKKPSQSCPRRSPDCETALFFFKHLLRCVAVTYSMGSLAL